MNRIRLLLIFTISWLYFVTHVEALVAQTPLDFLYIHPVVFVMAIGILLVCLTVVEINQLPRKLVIAGLIGGYGLTQLTFPRESLALEGSILHTVFEMSVLIISYWLSDEIIGWFKNYDNRLQEAAFSPMESLIASTFSDVEEIEKKISRARRFEHELSIVHVDLTQAMRASKLSKTVGKQVFSSHLAEMMQMVTGKSTARSWYNNNLVLCIPAGSKSLQVTSTIENMKAVLVDVMKVQAEITTASFPQDGLVLSDLVENATHRQLQPSNEKHSVVYPMPQLKSQLSS